MSRNTWDRERFLYERDRDLDRGGRRDSFADARVRHDEDDRYYRHSSQHRDLSVDDRYERRVERHSRPLDDDIVIQDSRRVYYDREPRFPRHSSPPADHEPDRRVVIERHRERVSSPSPPRRPAFLRRQSSLDTFDRRHRPYRYEEEERERYDPPARREEFRPRPYEPIPLPRPRALPPRRYTEREYHDEIRVSDPDYYGDEEFRSYPERVREREVIRTKRRDHSSPSTRSSRTRSHRASSVRSSSRSSTAASSSSSSSSGSTTVTVKSEYPKKGKTRIPVRLVSKRALVDLGYPFIEEGNVIVVLKALGPENIDDLLKLSDDYTKSELEATAARSEAGHVVEEQDQQIVTRATPDSHQPQAQTAPPTPAPPAEVVEQTTIIRNISPARSCTTSTSDTTTHTSHAPVVVDVRREEISDEVPIGPLALVRSERHRSRSRSNRETRSEIRELGKQLDRRRHGERELIKAERLSTGELVLYEEQIEKIEKPRRGVRIEKDKKGRMRISVPKRR